MATLNASICEVPAASACQSHVHTRSQGPESLVNQGMCMFSCWCKHRVALPVCGAPIGCFGCPGQEQSWRFCVVNPQSTL